MERLIKAKALAHNFKQVVPPGVMRFLDFARLDLPKGESHKAKTTDRELVIDFFTGSATTSVTTSAGKTLAHQSWSTNMLTLPADMFPSNVVASVSGLSGTGAACGGMLFTLLTGYLVDHFSYAPVFTLAAIMHPIAAMVLVFVVGRIKPVDIPVPAQIVQQA